MPKMVAYYSRDTDHTNYVNLFINNAQQNKWRNKKYQ